MGESNPNPEAEIALREWEKALTINVGKAYVCRACGNRVMVTKGGVGTLELACCGAPMELVAAKAATKSAPWS